MVKVFKFKGYSIDDLKSMSIDEFSKLLPARQRRTIKRGLKPKHIKLLNKVKNWDSDKPIRTHVRDMIIFPDFVDKKFAIHSGKEWQIVQIKPEMVGHYLGEFAVTRKRVMHSGPGIGATRGTKFISVK